MSGLERYHAPYDPSSLHQLHWTPGTFGKGLLTNDGILHHWNTTDFEDGNPLHRQYCQDHNIPANTYTPFWIERNGKVDSVPNQNADWSAVANLDPRLDLSGVNPDHWKFGDTLHQHRSLSGPPEIVDDQPGKWGWDGSESGWSARRPFIYHLPTNSVYIGKPGEHHEDIRSRHDMRHDIKQTGWDTAEGYAMKGLEDHPDEVSFYRGAPGNHEPILNALSEYLGVPVADPLGDDLWKFAWTEEEQELRKNDPLAFERQVDWDREGDVGRHRDVEWVPTHELKKFIEYDRRPGSVQQHSPERYKALAEHIREHGFKNPVQLEYNQDTGMAHMGEGNHRTWIALEYGLPAMPVRVNRSRRESPTQIPVDLQPQPEWASSFDDSGYHIPSSMKPSHIGLETVPPPGQRTASADRLGWTPGNRGKGLIDSSGNVHTWNIKSHDYDQPTHWDYKGDLGIMSDQNSEFWIAENGLVSFYQPHEIDWDRVVGAIQAADSRLHPSEESNAEGQESEDSPFWGFAKVLA